MKEINSRKKSFEFALEGLKHAFLTQPNFQIQFFIGIIVLAFAYLFEFNRLEWLILIVTVGLVLTAELLNTVIEVVVDLAVKESLLPEAKIAKDVSAAAVLLISIISAVVGFILFAPHFISLIYYL